VSTEGLVASEFVSAALALILISFSNSFSSVFITCLGELGGESRET